MASWLIPWFILLSLSWLGRNVQVASFATNAPTPPQTVAVNLTLANSCIAPDGYPRVAVLAGKQGEELSLPGPVISGNKGDRFLINVDNQLTDTTMFTGATIHWHGIFQHHSSQMDGTAYVTQCPISPGESFLYNFTGDTQVGTFWYHSHYAVQYCDGLRGPLIIRDPGDPFKHLYDFDDDSTVITLMDWYHVPSPEIPRQIWPDSVLINGTGCYDGMEGSCPPPATYTVQASKGYRFRLLNMSCKQFYNFTIDNHTMTVIEVDGNYVEPYTVDSIQIYASQRYSFILSANQPVDNYWVRAIPDPTEPMNATTTAILRYIGAPDQLPQTVNVTNSYLNESLLRSYMEPPARILAPEPDVKLFVNLSKSNETFNYMINGAQYIPPSIPTLLQIMDGSLSWNIDPAQSTYLLPRNKLIEVTFNVGNADGGPHIFHLHGHRFAVIKSADGGSWNFDRPVFRDSVSTGPDGNNDGVTIRFITDNPGPWILHCHIEFHLYTGMAIVFVEDYANLIAGQSVNNASRALCPYENPTETWALPPPNQTAGPYRPATTAFCSPTPFAKRGV